jgi:glycosyltransferase involved in cell wall biosynthesis
LFVVFCAMLLIQLFYYLFVFSRFAFRKFHNAESPIEPVSVVVCAHNEGRNLKENIPLLMEQDYPVFEVVVVNDSSEDDTMEVLLDFKLKYPALKVVNFQKNFNFFSGKKFPLSIGIKAASHDLILLTDADCKPSGRNWITSMQRNFNGSADIVLGYGKYQREKGVLNKLIRFDTFFIAILYFSLARFGLPYMGVGRNLAYRRSFFFKKKGFISHYLVPSGDDDLFVNMNANRRNTRIEIDIESHTVSHPKESFGNWVIQKKRHISTSRYYKFIHKVLLGLYPFTLWVFIITFAAMLFLNYNIIVVLSLFFLRILVQLPVLKKCSSQLGEKDLLFISPLFEILMLLINTRVFLSNYFFISHNKWK